MLQLDLLPSWIWYGFNKAAPSSLFVAGAGDSAAFDAEAALGERCCLKSAVPSEGVAPFWTGLAPRAVTDGKISKQWCQRRDAKVTVLTLCFADSEAPPPPPADGCKTVGGKCVAPYPGELLLGIIVI